MENCKAGIKSAHPGHKSILGKHLYAQSNFQKPGLQAAVMAKHRLFRGTQNAQLQSGLCAEDGGQQARLRGTVCVWRGSGRP